MNIYDTGIRPLIDQHLADEAKKIRDYGEYWSASSAGYCMRKNIFERLGVPAVKKDSDARKTRVFKAGDVFHEWIQGITKDAGLSIAQELELQDEELMIRGHVDDLVLVSNKSNDGTIIGSMDDEDFDNWVGEKNASKKLVLYDYKSTHSDSFHRGKNRYPLSHYHKMQVGTYMYMVRKLKLDVYFKEKGAIGNGELSEARILKISKDDLCMDEYQVLWSPALEKEVVGYWRTINGYWRDKKIPACTCDKFEGGFMARETFNPYFYNGSPCSIELYEEFKKEKENG